MTPEQLATLKAAILADPALAAYPNTADGAYDMCRDVLNKEASPAFIVYRASVTTAELGTTVNYDAVGALTSANSSRVTLFYSMNPQAFKPTLDVRSFFENTFGGALGGAGQITRDALVALWKRKAKRGEQIFAAGTGSDVSPGTLVVEGDIGYLDVVAARNLP